MLYVLAFLSLYFLFHIVFLYSASIKSLGECPPLFVFDMLNGNSVWWQKAERHNIKKKNERRGVYCAFIKGNVKLFKDPWFVMNVNSLTVMFFSSWNFIIILLSRRLWNLWPWWFALFSWFCLMLHSLGLGILQVLQVLRSHRYIGLSLSSV